MIQQQYPPLVNYDNEIDLKQIKLKALSQVPGSSTGAKKKISYDNKYVNRNICCEKGNFTKQREPLPIPLACSCSSDIY